MSARWYKRCGADFIHGTMSLRLEEKGAYSLCLDLIYDRGGPIPDDARWLSGVCGVSIRKWGALRAGLERLGFLILRDGHLTARGFDPCMLTEQRTPIGPNLRGKVTAASNGLCSYCGDSAGPFEVDHIHPVSRGGTDDIDNLTLACRPCNRSKGAKLLSEWAN